jgi:putative integral membrane protein (TIGR02587 family)
MPSPTATTSRDYAAGLARAFAGAVIFGLPLLMTMEMWAVGNIIAPSMLLQFTLVSLAMLYGLSRIAGFETTHRPLDDMLDALAAYGVAALVSLVALVLLGVIGSDTSPGEAAAKIAIQAIPASFGAMIGARMVGDDEVEQGEQGRDTYPGQLFLFAAGALFLTFTIAPTEEVLLVSFQVTPLHGIILVLLSILLLHAILHVVGFPGQDERRGGNRDPRSIASLLWRQTLPGYGIAVLVSAYILWTLGSTDGLGLSATVMAVAVLAFPGALGAGIARVVV